MSREALLSLTTGGTPVNSAAEAKGCFSSSGDVKELMFGQGSVSIDASCCGTSSTLLSDSHSSFNFITTGAFSVFLFPPEISAFGSIRDCELVFAVTVSLCLPLLAGKDTLEDAGKAPWEEGLRPLRGLFPADGEVAVEGKVWFSSISDPSTMEL